MVGTGQHIETVLEVDEELLWSHVMTDDAVVPLSRPEKITAKLISGTIYLAAWAINLFLLFRVPPEQAEQVGETLKAQLPYWVFGFGVMWFFSKSKWLTNLLSSSQRDIFQNGIITNRRILMFNHTPYELRAFGLDMISAAALDYENGGPALRISSLDKQNDSTLIGLADFKSALTIIQTKFLTKEMGG